MQNNFTWHLKYHAGGPTIFQPGRTVIKSIKRFTDLQYNGIFNMKSFMYG